MEYRQADRHPQAREEVVGDAARDRASVESPVSCLETSPLVQESTPDRKHGGNRGDVKDQTSGSSHDVEVNVTGWLRLRLGEFPTTRFGNWNLSPGVGCKSRQGPGRRRNTGGACPPRSGHPRGRCAGNALSPQCIAHEDRAVSWEPALWPREAQLGATEKIITDGERGRWTAGQGQGVVAMTTNTRHPPARAG